MSNPLAIALKMVDRFNIYPPLTIQLMDCLFNMIAFEAAESSKED